MKQGIRRVRGALAISLTLILPTGCTPLEDGFQEGVADGTSAALVTIMGTFVDQALDQTFGENE